VLNKCLKPVSILWATLGASGSRVFRSITIPLMTPALVSSFITLFMLNMADFGNPIIKEVKAFLLDTIGVSA
jgi:iron(III) transport system permease protein